VNATLTFSSVEDANNFLSFWARKTLTGGDRSRLKRDGTVDVKVYELDDNKKNLINDYIKNVK